MSTRELYAKTALHEVVLVAGEGFEPSKAEPGDLQSSSLPPLSNILPRFQA